MLGILLYEEEILSPFSLYQIEIPKLHASVDIFHPFVTKQVLTVCNTQKPTLWHQLLKKNNFYCEVSQQEAGLDLSPHPVFRVKCKGLGEFQTWHSLIG